MKNGSLGVSRHRRGGCWRLVATICTLALVSLSGCATETEPLTFASQSAPPEKLSRFIPQKKLSTPPRMIAAKAIEALDKGDLEEASRLLNVSLKLDIDNSYLQFFNAFIYHLRGLQGDPSLLELAEEGYRIAIRFDATNRFARQYLGLLYLDQRRFREAQAQLADAALYAPDDPDLLYQLASASYYAQDPVTSAAALKRLRELGVSGEDRARVMRASSIVMASLGDAAGAQSFLDEYRKLEASPASVKTLSNRLDSWRRVYAQRRALQLAQSEEPPPPSEGGEGEASGAPGELPSDFIDKQMVVVDVVMIGTEEDLNTSKGINLLSGLQIQFGGSGGTPGFSVQRQRVVTNNNTSGQTDERTKTISSLIQIPSITYSLNIANSLTERNEILARPTLVAQVGKQSEFFSGVEINAAAVSGGDGSSVSIQKEVGVKLSVTPQFLDRDTIALQVTAQRLFLTNPSASVVFDFRLDTTKTVVNANVVMKFGETMILSGLSEKEFESNRDGVPFLQDLPVIQYLFAKQTKRKFRKSVLILITPRRPAYTYQDDALRKATLEALSEKDRAVYEFESKYADWFRPYPSWGAVFHQLRENQLYREFRTGDVEMEDWNSNQSMWGRLAEAIGFLYY